MRYTNLLWRLGIGTLAIAFFVHVQAQENITIEEPEPLHLPQNALTLRTFNDTLEIMREQYRWDPVVGVWVPDFVWTYTYDQWGYITFSQRKLWNGTTEAWVNSSRSFFRYDSLGYLLHEAHEYWNTTDARWEKDYRYDYFYSRYGTTVGIREPAIHNAIIFPNPASKYIFIEQPGEYTHVTRGVIYTTQGQAVKTFTLSEINIPIYIGELTPGQYLLVLYNEGKPIYRSRFVKR